MQDVKRLIFHIDLNAFFCQCAQNKEPFLKKVPFAIAPNNNTNRGVLATSNYIARRYGVFSAMNIREAKEKCPILRLVPPNFKLYVKYSKLFFAFLKKLTPRIRIASIDEAYLDLTNHPLADNPLKLARKIQKELIQKYNLPTSIGISHTLFLAKMASDLKKPLGITYIKDSNLDILNELKVDDIWGIGVKTASLLNKKNIFKIKDFKNIKNKEKIISILTLNHYNQKINELNGKSLDLIPIYKKTIPKSISRELSLVEYLNNRELLLLELAKTAQAVYTAYNKYDDIYIKSFFVKFKRRDLVTKQKQQTLTFPLNDFLDFKSAIFDLFDKIYNEEEIKHIGCGVIIAKIEKKKINLFNYEKILKEEEKSD